VRRTIITGLPLIQMPQQSDVPLKRQPVIDLEMAGFAGYCAARAGNLAYLRLFSQYPF
jgi:hypothetical protein